MLARDWEDRYAERLLLVETFVDPTRYAATSYRAANWVFTGHTSGSGIKGGTYFDHGHPKAIFVYPLDSSLRKALATNRREIIGDRAEPPTERNPAPPTSWTPDGEIFGQLDQDELSQITKSLLEFHREFSDCFRRIEQENSGLCYFVGLLSAVERKNVERIALALKGKDAVRPMQRFLKNNRWNQSLFELKLRKKAAQMLNDPEGMLTIDSTEFRKKGTHSVGVQRQYCGEVGKVENCQSGVFLGYTGKKGAALLAARLFLPESWFSEEKRREWPKCDIPPNTKFQSKLEIARELVEQVCNEGFFQKRWIGCDCFFGRSLEFLESLPRGLWFFAEIPSDTKVYLDDPSEASDYERDRGGMCVRELAESKLLRWRFGKLMDGTKGPVYAHMARIRVWLYRDGKSHGPYWLFVRRHAGGHTKWYLSNAPENIDFQALKRAATMRWSIDECFRLAKEHTGMGDYETRSYIAWHRHMAYVMLALLFLLHVRNSLIKKTALTLHAAHSLIKSTIRLRTLDPVSAAGIVRYVMRQNHKSTRSHARRAPGPER
jgi:SRSO17 transposase